MVSQSHLVWKLHPVQVNTHANFVLDDSKFFLRSIQIRSRFFQGNSFRFDVAKDLVEPDDVDDPGAETSGS